MFSVRKTKKLSSLRPPLGVRGNVRCSFRLIGKLVVDFLLVIIELFSLAVLLVGLRATIDWKAPF